MDTNIFLIGFDQPMLTAFIARSKQIWWGGVFEAPGDVKFFYCFVTVFSCNNFKTRMINHKLEFRFWSIATRAVQKNILICFPLNSFDAKVGNSCCLFSCDFIVVCLANKAKIISDQWPENTGVPWQFPMSHLFVHPFADWHFMEDLSLKNNKNWKASWRSQGCAQPL